MRRFVDISVPLQAGIASDPPGHLPEIDYYDHKQTAAEVVSFFPGATVDDLPDREGWAIERVRISTHNGTHLDAPYHYASTMDGGKRAITIDEVPLEWCLQPAVKLDFRHFPDGYVVTAADVEQELTRIGHTLSPLEIVLVNTSAGTRYGQPDYVGTGCGMGRDATLYLLQRGCGSPVSTPGAGTRRSPTPRSATQWTTTRRSSGKDTAPVAPSATPTSRSCTTWSRCPPTGSRCPASR